MPVYEFYCEDCHTIFNFISGRVNTKKRPHCPKCDRPELERQVSRFAISKGLEEKEEDGLPDMDEDRMERAMMSLAGEMEGMNEEDPRAMAHMMRRFTEMTGMNMGAGMEEAIRRLEAGEDPDQVEAEMGDLFDEENMEDLFSRKGIKGLKRRYTPPAQDDTLYPLEP